MKFSRIAITGLAVAGGLLMSVMGTTAYAGIANTKHNLGSTSTNNSFSGTEEICVFCHTPHGADTSASVPLWNRTLANPSTYTTYADLNTTTLDGQVAPVGSVSIACLSCHDGTQALDTVINAPGSGLSGSPGFQAGVWTSPNGSVITAGADAGKLAAGIITNLGTDLRNDHPVGIQYGGGGITSGGGTTVDPDFVAPTKDANADVWWVNTTAAGSTAGREKTDMILYTRSDFTGGTPEPSVECASCHDPHVETSTFLRVQNTGSAVCLACHTK